MGLDLGVEKAKSGRPPNRGKESSITHAPTYFLTENHSYAGANCQHVTYLVRFAMGTRV
jgi:hypothetical protein